jgi:hypothetical protein
LTIVSIQIAGETHEAANTQLLSEAFASGKLPKLSSLRTSMRQALASEQPELMAMGSPMGSQQQARLDECSNFNRGILNLSLQVRCSF